MYPVQVVGNLVGLILRTEYLPRTRGGIGIVDLSTASAVRYPCAGVLKQLIEWIVLLL